jgi:hypothetical protein
MSRRLESAVLAAGLWAVVAAFGQSEVRPGGATAVRRLVDGPVDPRAFGTQDDTISVVSAFRFNRDCASRIDPATLSYYCCTETNCYTGASHYYAPLRLPAGAVIDYIGVNTATTVDAAMGFTLHFRDHLGGSAQLASFSFPAHTGFATDYAGPLGILIPNNVDREFVLDVETAPGLENIFQYFGYVEVWWHRTVSDAPTTSTFGDVPSSHPFFQFIEALAASGITGGCGSENFCPEAPLTRGQMAAFLAKALGLHWPQ